MTQITQMRGSRVAQAACGRGPRAIGFVIFLIFL
jgi:hypothetical protein